MHNNPLEPSKPGLRVVNRRGATAIAVLLLALGVGASTAAFALINRVMPHSAPFATCETTIEYTSQHPDLSASTPALDVPSSAELQERISDAYATSYEAAGDAVASWSDAAGAVRDVADVSDPGEFGDLGGRILALMLGAGALALLVACTRGAARALATSRASTLYVGVALIALPFAALLASALGLPALGLRAIAFAATVSVVAAYAARVGQKSQEGADC